MLLLFTAELPHADPQQALRLLEQLSQLRPSLRPRRDGGYVLTVPSGRAPLRTRRLLKEFGGLDPYSWQLLGIDDEGYPSIPISEETAA